LEYLNNIPGEGSPAAVREHSLLSQNILHGTRQHMELIAEVIRCIQQRAGEVVTAGWSVVRRQTRGRFGCHHPND
jgi:hypothetical protein